MTELFGTDFLDWLEEAGVIPPFARRVIIDAPFDGPVLIYVEMIADKKTLLAREVPQVLLDAKLELMGKDTE